MRYMMKAGTNILMMMQKKDLPLVKRSTKNQIQKPSIMTAPIMLTIRIAKSQHLSSIRLLILILMQEDQPYRFDIKQNQQWQTYLQQHGFVVIKAVLNQEEVAHTKNLFWEWLEALGSGIRRDDPSTWVDSNWPGSGSMGFFCSYGGCHTKASWYVRTHPNVQEAFSTIWKTKELITSFDTFISWRPWWNQISEHHWDPFVQNLHCDQNPCHKKGFHCVQGMVPFVDVTKQGPGGLQVVPDTNNDKTQSELVERYPGVKHNRSDWLELRHNDKYIGTGKLVECKAGDLILFDSRTIHGGKINDPSQHFKENNMNNLVRLAMTVCMVPRNLQTNMNQEKRKNAFKARVGLTHWPQEFNKSSFGIMAVNIDKDKIKYDWPELTPEIQRLI